MGPEGFEQIEIEFDPRWLNLPEATLPPVRRWLGGSMARAVGTLVRLCLQEPEEPALRRAVRGLIEVDAPRPSPPPAWVDEAEQMARADLNLTVSALSRRLDRHPAWVGAAYARHRGEELRGARARFRVERAAPMPSRPLVIPCCP